MPVVFCTVLQKPVSEHVALSNHQNKQHKFLRKWFFTSNMFLLLKQYSVEFSILLQHGRVQDKSEAVYLYTYLPIT